MSYLPVLTGRIIDPLIARPTTAPAALPTAVDPSCSGCGTSVTGTCTRWLSRPVRDFRFVSVGRRHRRSRRTRCGERPTISETRRTVGRGRNRTLRVVRPTFSGWSGSRPRRHWEPCLAASLERCRVWGWTCQHGPQLDRPSRDCVTNCVTQHEDWDGRHCTRMDARCAGSSVDAARSVSFASSRSRHPRQQGLRRHRAPTGEVGAQFTTDGQGAVNSSHTPSRAGASAGRRRVSSLRSGPRRLRTISRWILILRIRRDQSASCWTATFTPR